MTGGFKVQQNLRKYFFLKFIFDEIEADKRERKEFTAVND
jgi:hypothetical protein